MWGQYGNARRLDIRPVWLFDMQPTSVIHWAVLHIWHWANVRMSTKCRLLISDRGKKPISGRCGNAKRLDIRPVWLFAMQTTSVLHRAVLHIRHWTNMRMPAKCRLLISGRGKSRCRADIKLHGGSTSGRYGCFICSRQRSYIESCCTSDIGPTWEPMSARCRKVHRPDIGLMGLAYGANVLLYHTIAAMAIVTVHLTPVVIFSIWSFASIPRLPSWRGRSSW